MATGFYTVHALRAFGAPDWQVGVFTTLFLAGQMAANLTLGWLADRAGHRVVLALGVGALAAANVAALATTAAGPFGVAFLLAGVHHATISLSARTILLEFTDDPDERPTYVGLANTALAPLAFTAPLAAGLMADRLGLPVVFALSAAVSLVALALLLARVREPRRAVAAPAR
jgi:MFS family permease